MSPRCSPSASESSHMTDMPAEWMPREEWDALARRDGCPLCVEVSSDGADGADDADAFFVADLTFSRLLLARNQYVSGYSVLICREHVREPYELSRDRYQEFFDDLMAAGAALDRVFQP